MEKTKILITDDHQLFRSGLKALLSTIPEFDVVKDVGSAEAAIHYLRNHDIDIVIMDIHLSRNGVDMNGLEATREVLNVSPSTKVLLLSAEAKISDVNKMVEVGAKGFILKSTSFNEVATAIKTLRQGNSYFAQEVTSKLFAQFQYPNQKPNQFASDNKLPITDREFQVLKCIVEEKTNREIAQQLIISPRTVDTHRRNLLEKLKVKNTAGLVRYYFTKILHQGYGHPTL